MSGAARRRLVERTLLAGLGMSPDDLGEEIGSRHDLSEGGGSRAPNSARRSRGVISYENYARTVGGAFSRSFEEGQYVFRKVRWRVSI